MASTPDFVQYVTEQLSGAGEVYCKKMFGEYGVYCSEKFIGLIINNEFFLKPTEQGRKLLKEVTEASPYKGAKPHFLIGELEDKELLTDLIKITYEQLPAPKPKKRKPN